MNRKSQGFTLIELLVVITIIALLSVALLPNVLGSQMTANKLADQKNLEWHYLTIQMYKAQHSGKYPRYGGHRFIFDPWVRGVVAHTDEHRDRYFSPQAIAKRDPRHTELMEEDVKTIWKDFADISTEDTNYAGLAREHKRLIDRPDTIIMATDNEDGNIYPDGVVIVLFASGGTKQLKRDPDFMKYDYSSDVDEVDEVIEVGPNSRHPGLQKLAH